MSSTERFEAASISITSSEVPAAIVTHDSHSPQGVERRPVHAVERAGEDLRHRGLAGPARADEQVGVVDLVAARPRCAACARRAPGRRPRRRSAGGGGGRGTARPRAASLEVEPTVAMTIPIDPHRLPPAMARARQIRSVAAWRSRRGRGAGTLYKRRPRPADGGRLDAALDQIIDDPQGASRPLGDRPAAQPGRVPAPRRRQYGDRREAEGSTRRCGSRAWRRPSTGRSRCRSPRSGSSASTTPSASGCRRLAARRRDHHPGDARPHRRAPRLHPPAGLHRRADRRSGPVHDARSS